MHQKMHLGNHFTLVFIAKFCLYLPIWPVNITWEMSFSNAFSGGKAESQIQAVLASSGPQSLLISDPMTSDKIAKTTRELSVWIFT